MKSAYALGLLLLCGLPMLGQISVAAPSLETYNVTWDSPSKDSSGSMPLGNGDVGLNAWMNEEGELLFYISKTDAWSENLRLLKLGRIRITVTPNPFKAATFFRQTLQLEGGAIVIESGEGRKKVTLQLWVDANAPVVYVQAKGGQPLDIQVDLELWRTEDRALEAKQEIHSAYGLAGGPDPVIVHPDTVLPARDNRIVWFHRNRRSIYPQVMKHQGLEALATRQSDPLLHRTFGGTILGDGLVSVGDTALETSKPKKKQSVAIHLLTAQTSNEAEWIQQLDTSVADSNRASAKKARTAHGKWWRAFWDRSWIRVAGTTADEEEKAFQVTRGYVLQRFIAACAGRGAYPIKFNGSIFTVDAREPNRHFDADYRAWGGPYWFQNTRLPYWAMIATGDFDMMEPLFKMYLDALPLAKQRTKIYFEHDGAFFPETMTFWGTYANDNYGWDRKGKPVSYVQNTYIRYYWSGGLELTAMMLDRYAVTGDDAFAKTTLLPLAEAIVDFYDLHYPRTEDGILRIEPAEALETWHEAVNPLPEIAGLRYVLPKLLALPNELATDRQRETWRRLLGELPPLPIGEENGKRFLLPAETFDKLANSETPELYAVFPYRLYGVGKPDIELGLETFARRKIKRTGGWSQDPIQAALLGLVDRAKTDTVLNFTSHHRGSRFPAFWGPNFDWIPDQDHGSVSLLALQSMLMQVEGDTILLLPAWPKEWDVEFKLHAPRNTTLEGIYRDGKLKKLKVTPKSRRKDVTILE